MILDCENARICVKGVISMLKAMDVARYFLSLDADGKMFTDQFVTKHGKTFREGNARLNKYLHIAQNLYIAKMGCKLFSDDLYAFDNGAVVPSVREKYMSIQAVKRTAPELPDEYTEFLDKVYRVLKNASLDELITISHEDSEWRERNPHRENQRMNSLARADEYKAQYADMLKIMARTFELRMCIEQWI